MLNLRIRSWLPSAAAISLAALAAGTTGCTRDSGPADSGVVSVPDGSAADTRTPPGARDMGEGRWLEGAELEAYRMAYPPDEPALAPILDPDRPAPAPKSAAISPCLIDFNSVKGLNYMADKAYAIYATQPYYTQPCNLAFTTVRPVNKTYYYLPTEATGTCPGEIGKIGYGSALSCQNQQAASNFPRYAGNGTTTDATLGLRISIPDGASGHPFDLVYFFARNGKIKVTVKFAGGGTKTYENIAVSPGFYSFTDAKKVVEATFYSAEAGIYYIDNIYIRPL